MCGNCISYTNKLKILQIRKWNKLSTVYFVDHVYFDSIDFGIVCARVTTHM